MFPSYSWWFLQEPSRQCPRETLILKVYTGIGERKRGIFLTIFFQFVHLTIVYVGRWGALNSETYPPLSCLKLSAYTLQISQQSAPILFTFWKFIWTSTPLPLTWQKQNKHFRSFGFLVWTKKLSACSRDSQQRSSPVKYGGLIFLTFFLTWPELLDFCSDLYFHFLWGIKNK